jgi:predicted dehydrogenase
MVKKTIYKCAIFGIGAQTLNFHIKAIESFSNIKLIGVIEKNQKKLNNFLKNNENIKGYNNFNEFIKNNKDTNFVIISTSHDSHYEISKRAILEGLHILKEKPFAISLKQGREIEKLARKKHVHVLTITQRKFHPAYFNFFKLINKIGRIFYIDIRYTLFTKKQSEEWRDSKQLAGGGCVIDMGYHMIDLLIWYFGLPNSIIAKISHNGKKNTIYNTEDTAKIMFNYKKENDKFWGSALISKVISPKQEQFNVYGTKGTICIGRGKIELFSPSGKLKKSFIGDDDWLSSYKTQLRYFLKTIKEEKFSNDPKFHLNHMAFIESVYASNKQKIYINPKKIIN